jgi:hypothetical protein
MFVSDDLRASPDIRPRASRELSMRVRRAAGLLLSGLVAAGCGTSSSETATNAQKHLPKVAVSAAVRAQERAIHAHVMAALHGPEPELKRGIPAFIPRNTIAVNRIVTATPSHPQLAIQGVSVQLDLPSGRVLAMLNGPLVNNKYVGTNDPTVPAAFVLTFTNARGTIPLAPDDFRIADQLGSNIVPTVRVKGGAPLPKQLDSGQRLTLLMTSIVAAGDGTIVYNPTGIVEPGHRPLVGWDFIVEDD